MPRDDLLLEPWPYRRPIPDATKPDITSTIADAADRITAARIVTQMQREGKVSKLAAIAERIKAKKEAHDAKADEWASRLDAIERREGDAFAAGDAVVSEREADLSEMEATMRSLSNLPNGSGKS